MSAHSYAQCYFCHVAMQIHVYLKASSTTRVNLSGWMGLSFGVSALPQQMFTVLAFQLIDYFASTTEVVVTSIVSASSCRLAHASISCWSCSVESC